MAEGVANDQLPLVLYSSAKVIKILTFILLSTSSGWKAIQKYDILYNSLSSDQLFQSCSILSPGLCKLIKSKYCPGKITTQLI